jgi:hypothetical protein
MASLRSTILLFWTIEIIIIICLLALGRDRTLLAAARDHECWLDQMCEKTLIIWDRVMNFFWLVHIIPKPILDKQAINV